MTNDRDNTTASGDAALALMTEIPVSELPRGTRIRVEPDELFRLLESRRRSMDLILCDSSGTQPKQSSASARFLEADELVRSGYGELSVSEAAKQLDISRQAVLTAIKRGAIVARRVGGVFLVDAQSVRSYQPRGKSGKTKRET